MTRIYVPTLLDTDTYKTGHSLMYRRGLRRMAAYYTPRRNRLHKEDNRMVFFGMRYLYESVLSQRITMEDVAEADSYLSQHGVGKTKMYYPRDLFIKIIEENDGYWPVKIRALRDGSVVYPGIPCFIMEVEEPYQDLGTWLETKMMRVWSPCVTATKSALVKDTLHWYFEKTVDPDCQFLLESRLHDFSARGASSAETSMTTSLGHLLSFTGTDTMTAGWLATKWNNGIGVGESVYASEHSVMMSHDTELDAVLQILGTVPEGSIVSIVADTYSYENFLENILPQVVGLCRHRGIFLVIRPDSGDPKACVLKGLAALEKYFGFTVNSKGFKVINGAGIIQGDGLDLEKIDVIALAVYDARYSAQCVAYGMGGGLVQDQTRDTLGVAIKLCEDELEDGTVRAKMKRPATDPKKNSLPGDMAVVIQNGLPLVYPKENVEEKYDALEVIYDKRPIGYTFETFQEMIDRKERQWNKYPRNHEYLTQPMLDKLGRTMEKIAAEVSRMHL